MRTSHTQYAMLVEFMERNGDLSKPSGGPRGRHFIQLKWKALTIKLNSDGTGDSRPEEKWRKVWSDLKNNTKKKLAKIHRAASGTGGGPALQLYLTDLENRVMQIIGVQAAIGVVVVEAGFQQDEDANPPSALTQPEQPDSEVPIFLCQEKSTEDCNAEETSNQPTVDFPADGQANMVPPPSPIVINLEEPWKPPVPKKKKQEKDDIAKLFVETERSAREYARERDIAYDRLETERLRQHDYETRERVRQRDQELLLQAQWLEFMKEAMNVIVRFFEREKDKN